MIFMWAGGSRLPAQEKNSDWFTSVVINGIVSKGVFLHSLVDSPRNQAWGTSNIMTRKKGEPALRMKRNMPRPMLKDALCMLILLMLAIGLCPAVFAEASPEKPVPSKWGYENFKDYMPDLRNQGNYGSCWAVAATSLAEINLMRQGKMNNPDLSEVQLAYFYYHWQTDPLGGTEGDANLLGDDADNYLNVGGIALYAARIMSTWTGLARDEGVLKYPPNEGPVQDPIDPRYAYEGVARLRDFYVVDLSPRDPESMQEAKRIIMETGGLEAEYYEIGQNAYTYKPETNAYYHDSPLETNHSVVVVGWDDHFPSTNFSQTPQGDGAWLIRNSYTTGSYEDHQNYKGYFWMSYYTRSIQDRAVGFVFDMPDRYDNNYQYDGCAIMQTIDVPLSACYAANVFQAKAADYEDLMAASFYAEPLGADYSIQVYVSDTPMGANPESGTLKAVKNGKILHKGYSTVDLDSPVELKRGQYFSIVLTLRGRDENALLTIARERANIDYPKHLRTRVGIRPGQSFFRVNGHIWEDIYKENSTDGNMCIKAFTKNKAAPPTSTPTNTPTNTSEPSPTPAPIRIPQTGDHAPVTLWLVLVLLGTAGLGALALRKYR